ncbi:MAG: hypothetical protein J6Y00_06925 [Paludibacteraceae bacterium]|nr:hypothetical protein [Paludibacteraceae bacterium]
MQSVSLPISKSIANRLLILQSVHGDPLMRVSGLFVPDDVRLLHDALQAIHGMDRLSPLTLDLHNCGTAMRFLTAYCAQLDIPATFILDGDERMRQRPVAQEVDALRQLGADIIYIGKEGFPPLRVRARRLDKKTLSMGTDAPLLSSQFVSALLLIGVDVQTDDTSPYIAMTRRMIQSYEECRGGSVEPDWSSAAFWYEYVALRGGEIFLRDLQPSALQGDRCVADIFARLGVRTQYISEPGRKGTLLSRIPAFVRPVACAVDFSSCPDLYPAVAITCEMAGITLRAEGTERLPYKESDRLLSVREHRTHHDHRVAMALLAAGLPCDDVSCIAKSYPHFADELRRIENDRK